MADKSSKTETKTAAKPAPSESAGAERSSAELVRMIALTTIEADELGDDARHPYAGADSALRINRVPRGGPFRVPESDAERLVDARRAKRAD
jgi:hypothetical protein